MAQYERDRCWSAVAAVWPCCCLSWRGKDRRQSGARRSSDGSGGDLHPRFSVQRGHICKSWRKHGSCFLAVALVLQRKKKNNHHPPRVLLSRYGLFPPSQNGSRAVGSLAVQERSGSAEGRGEKPLGLPCSLRSTEAGSPRSCYG